MTSRPTQAREASRYDETEVRRRMGQVYTLLLELARERRLRNQLVAEGQQDPANSSELI